MDSFVSGDKVVEWPNAVGHWWFYGYRYGKQEGLGMTNKKELVLCDVEKDGTRSLMVTGNGQFFYKSEVEEAMFIPATLPELPPTE